MRADKLKELISVEQILDLMNYFGAVPKATTKDNELTFPTICHGGESHKLYFFKDTKCFHCYSSCGQMDIINVVENITGKNTYESILFISERYGLGYNYEMKEGFYDEEPNLELEYLQGFTNRKQEKLEDRSFKILDEKILDLYYRYYHSSFYSDNISFYTLYRFGIRYDILNQRVIIPHYCEDGNLIAIRCRNLDENLVSAGLKYTPINIDGKTLSAPTGHYLYGLDKNRENIIRAKRIVIFESEKSVMQLDTIVGEHNNIGVALMGSALSSIQVELIRSLGVEEVVVAVDKEFEIYGSQEEKMYAIKVRKSIINKLTQYFKVSIIWDRENLIELKNSPTDKGGDIFLKLFNTRIWC